MLLQMALLLAAAPDALSLLFTPDLVLPNLTGLLPGAQSAGRLSMLCMVCSLAGVLGRGGNPVKRAVCRNFCCSRYSSLQRQLT